jgi:hypothetical protein
MPRARNEVKAIFTGEGLRLVRHALGAKVIAAECERRNVDGSGD